MSRMERRSADPNTLVAALSRDEVKLQLETFHLCCLAGLYLAQLLTELGQRIQQRRRDRAVTQEELARRTGMKPATLSRIENGHMNAGIASVRAIADALGCTVGELLDPEPPSMTGREAELLRRWRSMDRESQDALWAIAVRLSQPQSSGS